MQIKKKRTKGKRRKTEEFKDWKRSLIANQGKGIREIQQMSEECQKAVLGDVATTETSNTKNQMYAVEEKTVIDKEDVEIVNVLKLDDTVMSNKSCCRKEVDVSCN